MAMMRSRTRHRQAGSALGEKLIIVAVMGLYCALLLAAFSQSLVAGFGIVGLTIGIGALVIAYGHMRDQRAERARVASRLSDLERAATAHDAVIDALFIGRGEGGVVAAFGVAGAAGKLFFARETYENDRTRVIEFGQVAAAFARPNGEDHYRLEVRSRPGDGRSPRATLFVRVESREEAGRWVDTLKPHLGDRAKLVDTADELHLKDEA